MGLTFYSFDLGSTKLNIVQGILVPGSGFDGDTPQPAAIGTGFGSDANAIARWDVVPYQTFSRQLNIGVVAFHVNGIDRVEFSVNGGPWFAVREMTRNYHTGNWTGIGVQSDGVVEYWATLRASDFADGLVEVRAIIYPNVGIPRVLQGTTIQSNGMYSCWAYANSGGSLNSTKYYIDPITGVDAPGRGAISAPWATIKYGLVLGSDGCTLVLTRAGSYPITTPAADRDNTRWITVEPADGIADYDCVISQTTLSTINLRTKYVKFNRMKIDHATVEVWDKSKTGYSIWWDKCYITDSLGWTHGYSSGPPYAGGLLGYCTNCNTYNTRWGLTGMNLARNSHASYVSEDSLRNNRMTINCVVDVQDQAIVGNHLDMCQYFGTLCENTIVYGVIGTNIHEAQLIMTDAPNYNFFDMAFVDMAVTSISNPDVPPYSQLASPCTHIYFKNIQMSTQRMLFRTDMAPPSTFVPYNVVFESCTFHTPLVAIPGVTIR